MNKRKFDETNSEGNNEKIISNTKLIEILQNRKNVFHDIVFDLNKSINYLECDIKKIDKILYDICEHNWEIDDLCYGPYDSLSKTCSVCKLNK